MNRFLNLASKALAVIGVLTLMWTAGGVQTAKSQPNPVAACGAVWTTINGQPGWITCAGTTGCGVAQQCCQTPSFTGGDVNNLANYDCCYFITCPGSG